MGPDRSLRPASAAGKRAWDGPGRDRRDVTEELGDAVRARLEAAVLESFAEIGRDADVVVVEGAGSATELTQLGALDLANVVVPARADAVALVARASRGGALAAVVGTLALLDPRVRTRVRGFAANDVRAAGGALTAAAQRVAEREGIAFLGAIPWLEWFVSRPQFPPGSAESDADHRTLGQAIHDHVDLSHILRWMELEHVL